MFPTSCIARELGTVDLTGTLNVKSFAYLRSRLLPGCTAVISLITIENKMGPNTVPWGTPLLKLANSVDFPSTTTRCCLLVKKTYDPIGNIRIDVHGLQLIANYIVRDSRKSCWNKKKILSRNPQLAIVFWTYFLWTIRFYGNKQKYSKVLQGLITWLLRCCPLPLLSLRENIFKHFDTLEDPDESV